jgi:uncharacterized protein
VDNRFIPACVLLTLLLLATGRSAVGQLVINEVDYDQPSTDTAEFIELQNVGADAVELSDFTLELINGSGGAVYSTIVLPAVALLPGEYFVVCGNAANVNPCDLDVSTGTDLIQNGAPDAIGLRKNGVLVDAVSYEGNTAAPYTEGSGDGLIDDPQPAMGLSRCPDGNDTDINNADLRFRVITPGAANDCPPPPLRLRIREIQGRAHRSPVEGQVVEQVPGVVTAVTTNGFWMQDPDSDSDEATSEGIFVFTGGAPNRVVGEAVQVNGTVTEFRPGGVSTGNLTITELTALSVTVVSQGNPLPAPIIIGLGGRVPPTMVINNDGAGNVENQPPATFDAATDGIDFYESLEGMRVQVNNARVVGPTNAFGETWVVGDNGASGGTFTPRGGIVIGPTDFNPERVKLDDTLYPGTWPPLDVGARFTSPVIGVVHYNFGNFELLVTELVSTDTVGAVTPETTLLVGTATALTVATFNVENLGGNDTEADFDARAAQIVNHLRSPDILILEEMQDNDGASGSGDPDATTTFTTLIAAIARAGGPTYQFQQIDPLDGQDGGEPGGNIRVGFLYNPARVGFAVRPGGDATTPTTVTCNAGQVQLALNPGRVDPQNPAFEQSRKPLAGEFTFNGRTLYIIGVHFVSKGGDNPLFGFAQPPVLASASQRIAQAQAVKDLVDTILACNPHANLIVLGDLNDFQCAPPVETLQGDVLTNLMQVLPPQEQYSYVFEGNSQVLDQMLVSAHLCIPGSRAYAVVHSNAEFATQGSDHDPSVARFPFAATLCSTLGTDRPPSRLDPELFTLAGHAGEEVPVR